MRELTDLEICQRIAEIEGKSYWFHGTGEGICMNYIEGKRASKVLYYNPLTDDALCFKLMVKYSVRVETENCSAWTDNDDGYPQYEVIHCKGTINKAICLAIIESKEET
jgi:hypothetical protein